MLTPDDGRGDGRLVQYLGDPGRWRSRDPGLFDVLHRIVNHDGDRSIAAVESSGILPCSAFHSAVLTDRPDERRAFFLGLQSAARNARLIFFDPDNGMEVRSVPYGRRGSAKYIYRDEITDWYRAGYTLLIYQHFPRVNRRVYLRMRAAQLRGRIAPAGLFVFSTSRVAYFLLAQPDDLEHCRHAVERVCERWGSVIRTARIVGSQGD